MSPGDYPRPEPPTVREYAGDRSWGTIIILFSALGLFTNLSTFFGSADLPGATRLRVVVFLQAGLLVVRLAGGIGILAGRRWGLLLVAIVSSVYVLLNLFSLTRGGSGLGIVSLLISAYIVYYCVRRLTGREGPPVA